MNCVPVGAPRGLRWGCLGIAAVVALAAVTSDAEARRSRHQPRHAEAAERYSPPYADIVIDAKTGAVLHESAPDAKRHPASLTKIMTLYLLFERLEAGTMTLSTPMKVSEHAASQDPTKLGLEPGETLRVEDAIKGLVTKSANDAAVVVAEAIGGSEEEFARMMTSKARAIGMRNTTYHNASGLPDDLQVTTARDQALLGIAIQQRFPKYYRYFSLESFVYQGRAIRNHNHLLGKVEGVDGIKTGYTRSSGFNLITSVKRGARHIVAVVLGGRSAGSRDARMRDLIDDTIVQASTRPPKPAAVATQPEPPAPAKPQVATAVTPVPLPLFPPPLFATEAVVPVAPGSTDPITPHKVKTVTVKVVPPNAATANARATMPAPVAPPVPTVRPDTTQSVSPAMAFRDETPDTAVIPPPSDRPGVLGTLPAMMAAAKEAAIPSAKADAPPPANFHAKADAPPPVIPHAKADALLPAKQIQVASLKTTDDPARTRPAARSGWAIQVGAYEDQNEAKQHLGSTKGKVAQLVHKAEAYIERTAKGAKTYFRVRFAGFDREQAEAICKKLKREDIACIALKI